MLLYTISCLTIGGLLGFIFTSYKENQEDKKLLELLEADERKHKNELDKLRRENASLKVDRDYLWREVTNLRAKAFNPKFDNLITQMQGEEPAVKFGD